jgi:hypothetical protein
MVNKCAECGGKVDCDAIICTDCLAEIIGKVNEKENRNSEQNELQAGRMEQPV